MAKKDLNLHETELKELDALLTEQQINDRIAVVTKNQQALEETLDMDPHVAQIKSEQQALKNEMATAMESYKDGTQYNRMRIRYLRAKLKSLGKPAGDFIGGKPMVSDETLAKEAKAKTGGKKPAGGGKEAPFNDGLQKAVGKFVEGVQAKLLPGESVTFKGPDGTGPTIAAKSG